MFQIGSKEECDGRKGLLYSLGRQCSFNYLADLLQYFPSTFPILCGRNLVQTVSLSRML